MKNDVIVAHVCNIDTVRVIRGCLWKRNIAVSVVSLTDGDEETLIDGMVQKCIAMIFNSDIETGKHTINVLTRDICYQLYENI